MRQLFKCRFFYVVILFGALNLLAGMTQFWQAKPTDYPYRSWTAWAIDDFLQQRTVPQLVFLGSSLVLVPVSGVDADYLNHRVDGATHHHSAYFENEFKAKTGIATKTFNFALPGEMPSDAYMITDFLLKDSKRPDVIVYGVGPRDFMDNLLPSPAATDPYRFLSRFGDISNCAGLMMPEWTERFNYELGRAIYMYGHRQDLTDRISKIATVDLNRLVPLPAGEKPMTMAKVKQIIPDYRPCELGSGEAFFRPTTAAEKECFVDNLEEYRKRYKKLKWSTFNTQVHFFESALASARQHGTKVVVVAMPITDINRSLLSDDLWKLYRTTVSSVATKQGASLIDLSEDKQFTRKDFGDTVHLHAGGGLRWMNALIERIGQDEAVLSALQIPSGRTSSVAEKTEHNGTLPNGGPL